MTHVPYPGCYCADCVEGGEPIGYINAEMLNRKSEFEANGMVMFDRPCGAATMPLYAEPPSARITGDKDRSVQSRAPTDLTARLHSFAKALETGFDFNVMKHLDVSMCCDGHMCGCQGSTVGQYLAHQLRGELPEEKLAEANRRLALARHRQSAERGEVVAWMYERKGPWPARYFHDKRTPAYLDEGEGWTETPLYTLPAAPEAVRTPIEGTSHAD